jgi:hypothetical protein
MMFRSLAVAAVASVAALATSSAAQVIYEPVQYAPGREAGYYSGPVAPDDRVAADDGVAVADGPVAYVARGGEAIVPSRADERFCALRNLFIDTVVYRELSERLDLVYCVPQLELALREHLFADSKEDHEMSSADVRDISYRAVPRYFRKGDLLRASVVQGDGSLVVPAEVTPVPRAVAVDRDLDTRPTTQPRRIIIIPKHPRPAATPSDKTVAAAK